MRHLNQATLLSVSSCTVLVIKRFALYLYLLEITLVRLTCSLRFFFGRAFLLQALCDASRWYIILKNRSLSLLVYLNSGFLSCERSILKKFVKLACKILE